MAKMQGSQPTINQKFGYDFIVAAPMNLLTVIHIALCPQKMMDKFLLLCTFSVPVATV